MSIKYNASDTVHQVGILELVALKMPKKIMNIFIMHKSQPIFLKMAGNMANVASISI